MAKFLDFNGLRRVTEQIRLRLDSKQDKLVGLSGQLAGLGPEGLHAVTINAGENVKLQRDGSSLTVSTAISHRNLLDNWYFANPINQKGREVYRDRSGQFVYTIDRFQMYNGEMSLTAGGLKLIEASPVSYTVIRQFVPAEYSPNLIFSAIINGSLYSCAMDTRTAVANVGTLTCEHSGTNAIVSFVCTGEAVVFAAKLEEGSGQTLAHQDAEGKWVLNDPPPDRTLELAKCQRYYQVFSTQELRPVKAEDFRPVMRINPALGTMTRDGTAYYTADANL